jgi:hypothetical protein
VPPGHPPLRKKRKSPPTSFKEKRFFLQPTQAKAGNHRPARPAQVAGQEWTIPCSGTHWSLRGVPAMSQPFGISARRRMSLARLERAGPEASTGPPGGAGRHSRAHCSLGSARPTSHQRLGAQTPKVPQRRRRPKKALPKSSDSEIGRSWAGGPTGRRAVCAGEAGRCTRPWSRVGRVAGPAGRAGPGGRAGLAAAARSPVALRWPRHAPAATTNAACRKRAARAHGRRRGCR